MGKKADKLKAEILRLAEEVADKRSDIEGILDNIAYGQEWRPEDLEQRHISTKIAVGGVELEIEYDTLTTLFEIRWRRQPVPEEEFSEWMTPDTTYR